MQQKNLAWVVAKWSIAPERKMKEFGHPVMFPEKLLAKIILAGSNAGDDPFLGSGTTSVVAKKPGRNYCGIEKDLSEKD